MEEYNSHNVSIFYELLNHYDIKSRNIGIVGTKNKFNNYVKQAIKSFKKYQPKIIWNEEKTKCIILVDDIEYTYKYIRTYTDLIGYRFRKFI